MVTSKLDIGWGVPCDAVLELVELDLEVTKVEIPAVVTTGEAMRDEEVVKCRVGSLSQAGCRVVLSCAMP